MNEIWVNVSLQIALTALNVMVQVYGSDPEKRKYFIAAITALNDVIRIVSLPPNIPEPPHEVPVTSTTIKKR